jgi:DNA-binding response OmpR family regulator
MAKVLVVDDVNTYRHYLALELESQGYEVGVAGSADEAILLGNNVPPDVLVVDWMLNDPRTGLDVAAAVREANPRVQTILITGHPSAELRRAAIEQGLWFMKKPFTLSAISKAVGKAVRSATA